MTVRDALEAPADDPDAGRAVLDVDLYADGTSVFATGKLGGHVRVACGRCVGPVDIRFDDKVQVTFLPKHELETDEEPAEKNDKNEKKKKDDDDDGVELEEEDLDLFPYEG